MKVSIIVPTYTRSDKLRSCLASIVAYTDLSDTEIIVVANGASKETRDICEVYREFPVTLLWFPEPLGYPKAVNEGIKASTGEFVVLLNDDAELLGQLKNDWIDKMLKPMLADPLVGLTGPLKEHDPNSGYDFIIFFCVMIRRKVFDSIGLLDEIFSPYFGEDTDFSIRAELVGWKSVRVPEEVPTALADIDPATTTLEAWKHDKMWTGDFPIWHDAESTIGRLPESEDVLRRNREILKERYGPKVKELNTWRAKSIDGWFGEDEIEWLAGEVAKLPKGARVLEVGAWHGRSSRAIADNLPEGAQSWHVDTWIGSSGEPEMHGSAHYDRGDHAHQWWWCNLQEHINAGRVVPVRMHSDNAAHTIGHLIEKGQMEKFDLIFIDGDHSEEGIRTDVEAWLPLLKEEGLMCGHDYYKENEGPYWVHVRQYVEVRFPNVEKSATSIWHVRPHQAVEVARGNVYDGFLFHNELDVLEIRLATLNGVVDRFVLVEGTMTHAGQPKPLHFDENKERFEKYLHKISHIVVDDWPEIEGNVYDKAWARERHQRDAILHGLKDCEPNDIVILGDADEIANPEAVKNYKVSDGLVRLKQRMFYYYLNCENKEGWDWQKIAPYSMVQELTPCGIRYPPAGDTPVIENGGWHFSFCGSTEHIQTKLRDYSHQEFNRPDVLEGVETAREQGVDLFGRDLKYEFVGIDDDYPQYVKDNYLDLAVRGLIKPRREDVVSISAHSSLPDLSRRHWTVTACVSTKDRYQTTLPMCLSAIINQTRKPDKLVIYDDGEQRDLRGLPPFDGLLMLATDKGIDWQVQATPRKGQVANHQHCLDNATTDYVWRVDDDEIPEPDCLDVLLNTIRDRVNGDYESIGAVAGLVHHPGNVQPLPEFLDGSLNDVKAGLNLQWYDWNSGPREVEHLYSTFLYQVDAARKAGGYPKGLSQIGHREETLFSHSIKRAGYKLLVTPHAKTAHLRESTGGIRSFNDGKLWEHDEQIFQSFLNEWDANGGKPTKVIVIDAGIGDHYALKSILPKLKERHVDKELILSVCYPEVFKDTGLKLISIADAKQMLGPRYEDSHLYKHMWDAGNQKPLAEAMLEFWG